jgi:hypothetical protein
MAVFIRNTANLAYILIKASRIRDGNEKNVFLGLLRTPQNINGFSL